MPPRRRDTLPKTHRRVAGKPPTATSQPRRISRREREEQKRRQLFWGIGIAGALIVVILAGAALNEYWLKPRHVLATVDGTDIRRRDYWKYRAVDLADQANQYAAIANSPFVDQSQAQQYLQLAQQASAEIDDVWGSTDLDEATLQRMIEDQIYLKSLDEFDITITDQDVQDYIDQRFQPAEAPIFTPTPTPTLIPERAAWATETAVAAAATEAAPETTPEPASPVASPASMASPQPVDPAASPEMAASPGSVALASPVGSPAAIASPQPIGDTATPIASPELASPVADASPGAASPVATMEPSPTPNQEQARQTATANFDDYEEAIFDRAHLSRSDYEDLIVRPAIARERINDKLTAGIGQSAEQVHASHILVDTKDLADAIYADLMNGADFAQAARDQSIDSGTAPNGGDLGWFTRGQMVDPFEEVAFTTQAGQISAPFETEFGWHIVLVHEHAQDRAMTDDQITQLRGSLVDDWLSAKIAATKIDSEIEPTATSSAPENFVPPPDAPPLPTETPVPTLAPAASPESLPSTPVTTSASPVASPVS
ncbi:MAG: peptidylprolyl isomerase [Thermomicrobiales bacterium]|nr:peptidylprolyl isomerase [Thermomicrobiales bacterium]